MPKNKTFFLFFFALIFLVGIFSVLKVEAAGQQYTLLEKIPFLSSTDGSSLPAYVNAVYKTAMAIIVLCALFMLSVGGFMYLTSAGNTSAMSTAKDVIFDSIIGLVIALTAWLLLNVINPDLVNVTINGLSAVPTTPGVVTPPTGPPPSAPSGTVASKAQQIIDSGVLAPSGSCSSPSGPVSPRSDLQSTAANRPMAICSNGCNSSRGCTDNAINPSENMLNAIINVKNSGANFTITSIGGGSHANNSAHYQGRAIDIVPVTQALLDAFVTNGALPPNGNAASMCERDGVNVGCTSGRANHIHLIFPS